MSYVLLSGATGLLGQYLLYDLLAAGTKVACLVRDAVGESARERVDHSLQRFERILGRSLPRPVILVGDLNRSDLGLGSDQAEWAARRCRTILHSAASLEFYAVAGTKEPYRTNVEGTANLLAFAQRHGINEWHHVSTAYVCGMRTDLIREEPATETAGFGNDYERSKFAAEQLVRGAGFLCEPTIYRPSIIVGDSRDGYTSTYQGFYVPVRAGHSMAIALGTERLRQTPILSLIGLQGTERKNFVHVDWVSSVITHLVRAPASRGKTFHVTNPRPVAVADMNDVMTTTLADFVDQSRPSSRDAQGTSVHIGDLQPYYDQLRTYRNYFRDEPTFDVAQTLAATPHLPCPHVDRRAMKQLVESALAAGFGWPRPQREPLTFNAEYYFAQRLATLGVDSSECKPVDLTITGSGGGEWNIRIARRRVVAMSPGHLGTDARMHLSSRTMAAIVAGELTCRDAVYSGRLILEDEGTHESAMFEWAEALLPKRVDSALSASGMMARPLSVRGLSS